MKIVLCGAGSYGKVYLSYLQQSSRFEVVGFLDDNPDFSGKSVEGIPVLGTTADFPRWRSAGIEGVIAPIGNNEARVRILESACRAGLQTPSFIHPSVQLADDCFLGQGVYILAGSIVMPFVAIADYVMISAGVNIAHHTVLGRGAFLSMGANVGAEITIGEKAFVGIGATVMTGVRNVGARTVVGAGAVLLCDVPPDTIVAGVPAKPLP